MPFSAGKHECAETIRDEIDRTAASGPDDVDRQNRRYRSVRYDVRPTFANVGPVTAKDFSAFSVTTRFRLRVSSSGTSQTEYADEQKRKRVDDKRRFVTDVCRGPATERCAQRHEQEPR